MDSLTPERRSWNMSRIRSKNTKPELIVRSLLHRMGFRFRINRKDLPGKPDIVLPKYKTVIFVHGCYWHRHPGCKGATTPKTSAKGPEFWQKKFHDNVQRDRRSQRALRQLGWRVIVVWECSVVASPLRIANRLHRLLAGSAASTPVYTIPQRKELLKAAESRADYSTKSSKRLHS